MEEKITNVQLLILEAAAQKDEWESSFQDNWTEYCESYDDYNDCHGDYYDAE